MKHQVQFTTSSDTPRLRKHFISHNHAEWRTSTTRRQTTNLFRQESRPQK